MVSEMRASRKVRICMELVGKLFPVTAETAGDVGCSITFVTAGTRGSASGVP